MFGKLYLLAGNKLHQPAGGVDGVVVAEVAIGKIDVAAHLAGQQRLLLADLGLDEEWPVFHISGLPP